MPGDGNCNCGEDCGPCEWFFYGTTSTAVAAPGTLFTTAYQTNTPWAWVAADEINA